MQDACTSIISYYFFEPRNLVAFCNRWDVFCEVTDELYVLLGCNSSIMSLSCKPMQDACTSIIKYYFFEPR